MNLKRKILSTYITSAAFLLTIGLTIVYFMDVKLIKGEVERNLKLSAKNNINQLKYYFNQKQLNLKNLSERQDVSRSVFFLSEEFKKSNKNNINSDEYKLIDSTLSQYVLDFDYDDLILINAKDGKVLYSSKNYQLSGVDLTVDELKDNGLARIFKKTISDSNHHFEDFSYSLFDKKPVMYISFPVYYDSQLTAVIVGMMESFHIDRILKNGLVLGKSNDIYIIGNDLLLRSGTKNSVLSKKIETLNVKNIFKEKNTEPSGLTVFKNDRGQRIWGNSAYIPEFQWALLNEIEATEALSILNELMLGIIVIAFVFAAIIWIIAVRISVIISGPIEALIKGSEIIMSGNLDYVIGANTNDEIGNLSRAVDNMTAKLKKTYEGLKEKSADYARNLEQSERQNKILEDTKITMMNILEDLEMERRKLQLSEARTRAVIENALDGIIVMDDSGNIVSINPAGEKIFGCDKKDLVGQNIETLIDPSSLDHNPEGSQNLQPVLKRILSLKRCEIVGKRNDGNKFTMDFSLSPMHLSDRKMYTSILRDITERKEAEARLVQQKRDLEKINLELDSFVYTASHDLRAPLRGIASFATFLEEDYNDKLDDEGKDYIQEIRKGAERLSALIDDLLALSRISRIKNPYEFVNINELINAAVERLEFDIKEYNVDFKIEENMPTILCDRIKISEVFLNLINNAIKFTSKINEQPRIFVGHKDNPEFHEFYVKDNGIGIDPQYHQKIFGIFKRLHKAEEYTGTGAGLSIVKRVINDHEGEVWIVSEIGKGAEFHFSVPKKLKEKKKIGEMLVEEGIISQEELNKKLNEQRRLL